MLYIYFLVDGEEDTGVDAIEDIANVKSIYVFCSVLLPTGNIIYILLTAIMDNFEDGLDKLTLDAQSEMAKDGRY